MTAPAFVREDLSQRTGLDWRKIRQPTDLTERFWARVQKGDGCWLWTAATTSHGYGVASWRGRVVMAHRIAWELAYGEWPGSADVCHTCDNPPCCNPAHLFLGDAKSNAADMVAKGRGRNVPLRGEANGHSRLTSDMVRSVRLDIALGVSAVRIARGFGCSPTTIRDIRSGRTWGHVR